MAQSVQFKGSNKTLTAPAGKEAEVVSMEIFTNGRMCVSCWQLSKEELQEIIDNDGKLFLSVMMGATQPPVFIGSESAVRELFAHFAYPIWKPES